MSFQRGTAEAAKTRGPTGTLRRQPRHQDRAWWDDYPKALDYRFTGEDEALIDGLVASGHPSTPGYNDPAYPIEGRRSRTA
jgi:hypothetical protein